MTPAWLIGQFKREARHADSRARFRAGKAARAWPIWNRTHLHCVVPGGGIGPGGAKWIGCRKRSFFLPVQVLSSRFRNLFLTDLREAFEKGKLHFHGEMAGLARPAAFDALCSRAKRIKWVVFVKPSFGGPEQVLNYLTASPA